ncbi:MAG: hypothetical protein ACFFD1_03060 [Candidatus Thorarchaeota archaeon]
MVIFKDDADEAKSRLEAGWDHEIVDRPVFSYYASKKRASLGGYLDARSDEWTLAQQPEEIETVLNGFEKRAESTFFGGESIPSFMPNYGSGIVSAMFGVIPKFQSQTVWFSRPTDPKDIISHLESVKFNQNNEWYERLLRVTEYAARRSKGAYQISVSDIGGVLDTLSSFLGPIGLILTMRRKPEIIDTCRRIILEKLLFLYDKLQNTIEKYCNGCNSWLNVWCRKRWYPVQCDFIAMLNPKWFKRFALPDIKAQINHMDYALYHMDGHYQIAYLKDLLSIPKLTGIQWVPGAGKAAQGEEAWMELYKTIQNAGKSVVIDTPPENVHHLYANLNPKLTYVRTYYFTKTVSKFYLPSFINDGGVPVVNDTINWCKEKRKIQISKDELDDFLLQKQIDLDKKTKKEILREINLALVTKHTFH